MFVDLWLCTKQNRNLYFDHFTFHQRQMTTTELGMPISWLIQDMNAYFSAPLPLYDDTTSAISAPVMEEAPQVVQPTTTEPTEQTNLPPPPDANVRYCKYRNRGCSKWWYICDLRHGDISEHDRVCMYGSERKEKRETVAKKAQKRKRLTNEQQENTSRLSTRLQTVLSELQVATKHYEDVTDKWNKASSVLEEKQFAVIKGVNDVISLLRTLQES
jgi:hypothetical protein